MFDPNIQPPDWLLEMTAILEALNEGVVIVDDQLRIVFANEALLRLGGYNRGEIYGRTPDGIFPQQDLPYLMQQHAAAHAMATIAMSFIFRARTARRYPSSIVLARFQVLRDSSTALSF